MSTRHTKLPLLKYIYYAIVVAAVLLPLFIANNFSMKWNSVSYTTTMTTATCSLYIHMACKLRGIDKGERPAKQPHEPATNHN